MTAVTAVAWARVVIVSGIAAVGSFFEDASSEAELFFVIVGLVWVPWSVVVLFASERPGAPVAVFGGPIGDLVVLLTSQLLVPSAAEAALVGELVLIAFAAHSAGRRFASELAFAALTGTWASQALDGEEQHVEPALLLMFAATAVAIVLLLDRATSLRDRANAAVARLQSSSDAVLARVADAVVVTDSTGTIASANAAVDRLVGATTPLGATCEDVLGLHIDERRLSCREGCALLALADDGMGVEVWRTCDGRRQPLLANVGAVTDEDDVVVEVVHSLRDITKIKQSEEAKTLFLATASHELKTPLTVIRGFVETIRSGALDAEQQAVALEAVHRRTIELGEIVDRLLLSSRIEAGRVDLGVGDIDIAEVVEERASAMGAARGRTIRVTLDPGVGSVRGDQMALATALDHLIDNAVKYSPDGGDISIRAFAGDPVMLTVSDRGIGMDREELQHCFERFWQAEGTDVRRFGGTGIGLYIVRSLIEAMGGRITVESEKGVGTTFVVELPRSASVDIQPTAHRGEATIIREFMRQIGVPERAG
jgi:PAS domain S-box-containing protein